MHKTLAFLLGALLLAGSGSASGQDLNGQRITLKADEVTSANAPVAVAWTGPAPETSVEVVEEGTGNVFPATVREGELVFVPTGVTPRSAPRYTVRVTNEKRAPRVKIAQRGDLLVLDVTLDDELFTAYNYAVDKSLTLEAARKLRPALTEDQFKRYDADGDGMLTSKDRFAVLARREKGELTTEVYDELEAQLASFINRKPFLWPLLAEGQATVTRNWPMGESEGPTDHVHQKSFWTAHGDVNGATFWEETDGRSGFQMVDDVTWGSGDAYGWIRSAQTWQSADHKPILTEVREYRFYASPASGRLFDLNIRFTAAHGDAVFGDTKEGGIAALRIRPEIQEKKGTGLVTTADGKQSSNVWGKPSAWCDYTGTIAGLGARGVTIMDNPGNPIFPARWHVRDYGLMAANYFGLHDFDKAPDGTGDWTLKNGDTVTFRYRVLVHSGTAEEAKIADRYQDYAKLPSAAIEP